jgi:hypothetical protein
MRLAWAAMACAVFVASLAAHVATFLGIDPMETVPGVMGLHFLIFPPFIAGIVYCKTAPGGELTGNQVQAAAPRWLPWLTGLCFVYAFVNFGLFMVLSGGGGPKESGGKYYLSSHGRVVRELTEAEYHQQRAYVVRGFSGHWMLFSSAALLMIVGSRARPESSSG